ncbi:MAG: Ig-like domain repeat protein [Actinomycetota bacterium]|nr:Ig-like domain repeat protein [Actinomycetota bacterium]
MKCRTIRCVAGAIATLVLAGLTITAPAALADVNTFQNTTPIPIADKPCPNTAVPPCESGKGNPYPSTISVSGMAGTITKVTVTLKGVTHTFPDDIDVLLVGPAGQNLVLVSDAGGSTDVTNFDVTFDDAAAGTIPDTGGWITPSKPVDYDAAGAADPFPAPAPAPSAATTLATFNGSNPNGTWSLYVVDDGLGDTGTIGGGWSITITTNATAAATATAVASSQNPSTTGNNVTFTATVTSGGSNVGANGTVTFKEGSTTLAGPIPLNSSGQASFTTNALAEGSHVITAVYSGTDSFATSSGGVTQVVNNATVVNGSTFCNTGPITIPDSPALPTPYPSNIFVTGLPPYVTKVTATLKGVTHPFPDDLDVLLVGPTGQNLVLVSDAGGNTAVSNFTVTFDDAAASSIPDTGPWISPSKPVNYGAGADTFPAPAPAPSAATTLAAFNGTDPNGTWSLYVVDDALGSGPGSIAGGWCLAITAALPDTTPPSVTVEQAAGQTDPTSTSPVNFTATFSEPVTGFTASDVVFTGSTVGGTLSAIVTGGPTVYNIAVSGMTSSGTVVVTIPAGAAADLASNPSLASTSSDNSVLYRSRHSLPAVVTGSVNWKLRDTLTSGPPTISFTYGTKPLTPVMGDWDGNGTKTPGTFESGVFKLSNSVPPGAPDLVITFGDPRGFPVVGDWNGDGLDDLAVFRAGVWQTRLTGSGTVSTFSFGPALNWPTVVPVAGDWDGDGVDGIGVYNLSGGGTLGEWNLRQTATAGAPDLTFTYGGAGLYPVVGDWNADGTDGVGTKVMAGTEWALRNTASAGAPDLTISYGAANDFPLVWRN